jgi:flagellar motility protein MotE (MotC chaperone)
MYKLILTFFFLISLVTSTAFAEETATITPLKKGQVAPYDGNLLSPKAVATIIAQLDAIPSKIQIEVDKTRSEEKAQCQFQLSEAKTNADLETKIKNAKIEQQIKSLEVLQERIAKLEKETSGSTLWVTLGVTGGLLVGAGATFLLMSAVK